MVNKETEKHAHEVSSNSDSQARNWVVNKAAEKLGQNQSGNQRIACRMKTKVKPKTAGLII